MYVLVTIMAGVGTFKKLRGIFGLRKCLGQHLHTYFVNIYNKIQFEGFITHSAQNEGEILRCVYYSACYGLDYQSILNRISDSLFTGPWE